MLDTKLKKFKDKYIVTIIVFILMLSASLGMISQYSTIQAGAKGGAKNPFEQESFVDSIYKAVSYTHLTLPTICV